MAKKSTQEPALPNNNTFIPAHYFPTRYFSTPPRMDKGRGELTEGKNITGAFTELRREAKAVQYRLLRNMVSEVLGVQQRDIEKAKLWPGFAKERDAMTKGPYGDTLNRALRTWTLHTVRIATEEEARAYVARDGRANDAQGLVQYSHTWYRTHCEREGIHDPELSGLQRFRAEHCNLPDLPDAELVAHFEKNPLPAWFRMSTTEERRIVEGPQCEEVGENAFVLPTTEAVQVEEQYNRWIIEFAAEVDVCVERFSDSPDLAAELTRLIDALRSFEVGTGEGNAVVEHLRNTGSGGEVLTMMQHGTARLLQRLVEMADEYAPVGGMAPAGQQIRWKGNTMELAELIHNLETNGWIEGGRTRSKLAQLVATLFTRSDGEPLELSTLKTYLGKAYPRTPREGVEFAVTKNPDKT